MGRSLPSAARLHNFARIISSERINTPKQARPTSARVDPAKPGPNMEGPSGRARVPLSEVVSDCVKRWFKETLKEAKNGDFAMQLLVGQMYNSGYGVRKDTDKGRAWITRASKGRSTAFKISDKQPGYNASDSDSEGLKDAKS